MIGAEEAPCLLWEGRLGPKGLPVRQKDGQDRSVRHLVYEEHHGPLPHYARVKVTCGNPLCLEPTHLTRQGPSRPNSANKYKPCSVCAKPIRTTNPHCKTCARVVPLDDLSLRRRAAWHRRELGLFEQEMVRRRPLVAEEKPTSRLVTSPF